MIFAFTLLSGISRYVEVVNVNIEICYKKNGQGIAIFRLVWKAIELKIDVIKKKNIYIFRLKNINVLMSWHFIFHISDAA